VRVQRGQSRFKADRVTADQGQGLWVLGVGLGYQNRRCYILKYRSRERITRKRKESRKEEAEPSLCIEGNPSIAFATRLIHQYQSHIRVTKETIQFVINPTKEIPHSNRVTKERTPKLSQHVSHQGTVSARPSPGQKSPEAYSGSSGNGPGLSGYRSWNASTVLSLLIDSADSHVVSSYPSHFTRYRSHFLTNLESKTSCTCHSSSPSTSTGGGGGIICPSSGSLARRSNSDTWKTLCIFMVFGNSRR